MQDAPKAVWSIPYVSLAFFPSLKHNFNAYRSSKVSSCPDCIFEIHQLWQSDFSCVYSNSGCSCWFEPEIIKIGRSSHKMYSNNILNFEESPTILNACTKKSGNLFNAPSVCTYHLVVWSNFNLLHNSLWITCSSPLRTSFVLLLYQLSEFAYYVIWCFIYVSISSTFAILLHIIHFSSIWLVLVELSCTAIIRELVSFLRYPLLI